MRRSNIGKRHGLCHHRLYGIWRSMKFRCSNPGHKCFHRYGGRGVSVCEEWRDSFFSFYTWAISNGYDSRLQIDRIDNDGNYCPENCQWITGPENVRKSLKKFGLNFIERMNFAKRYGFDKSWINDLPSKDYRYLTHRLRVLGRYFKALHGERWYYRHINRVTKLS